MKQIIYLACILFTISSCDILDFNPTDKISEADTWNDPALMQLYVNANYNAILHGFDERILASTTDESHCIHNNGSEFIVQRGELTADNVSSVLVRVNFWSHAYSYLRNINTYLSKVDDTPADEEFKKTTKGEMKFLRAYIYANLIWRYGGVPLITEVYGLNEDYKVTRNSYEECVDFIISELDEAIQLLPAKQPDSQTGRASGHACMALKSRVLLYAASALNNPSNDKTKWQKAADATEALLQAGYALYPDYQELFLKDNNEIIFARYFTQGNSVEFNRLAGRNGSNGSNFFSPTQNLVNAYEMAATGELPYTEQADGSLTVNTVSGYDPNNPYVGRDPRFEATILHDGSMWAGRETETYHGGLDSPESSIEPWNASLTSYILKKWVIESIPPKGSSEKPTNPWIYFRYGEILLNYAEAKFELGDEETAREYLNKIRKRESVNMPEITDSGDKLRKRIQHERRIELAYEDHRFFDVRRWKIASETEKKPLLAMDIRMQEDKTKTYQIVELNKRIFSDHHYLIPIPRTEIDKSLNSLVQNPGY